MENSHAIYLGIFGLEQTYLLLDFFVLEILFSVCVNCKIQVIITPRAGVQSSV